MKKIQYAHGFCYLIAAAVGIIQFSAFADDLVLDTMVEINSWTRKNNDTHITGTGGFEVKGGSLHFNSGAFVNDFSGGIVMNPGTFLQLDNSVSGTPFGAGDITFNCDGASTCIGLFGQNYETPNKIIVAGDSTLEYPVIDASYSLAVFNEVVGNGDVYLASTYGDVNADQYVNTFLRFKNGISAAGHDIGGSLHCIADFAGAITCDRLVGCYGTASVATAANGRLGGFELNATGNKIGQIVLDSQNVCCMVDGAIAADAETSLRFEGQHPCVGPSGYTQYETGYFSLNGNPSKKGSVVSGAYTQTLTWIESDARTDADANGYGIRNQSSDCCTLVLIGAADKTATACVNMNGNMNLTLSSTAPATFRQVLKDRTSTMTGVIAVNGGTLAMDGAAKFSAATTMTVDGGTVEVAATSSTASFPALTSLAVSNGGTFRVESGAVHPFGNYATAVALSNDSHLVIPADMVLRVKSITIDGELLPASEYSSEELPQISGGRVVSSEGQAITVTPITWTGAQSTDAYLGANWGLASDPTFGLYKYLPTFAASGNEAVFAGKNRFAGMVFNAANGFAVSSAADNTSFSVNGDISATAENAVYAIEPSVEVIKASTVTVAEGTTLACNGGFSTAVDIAKAGAGTLTLGGTGTIDAKVTLGAGKLVYAGTVNGSGSVEFTPQTDKTKVVFSNAMVSAALTMKGGSVNDNLLAYGESVLSGCFSQSGSLQVSGGGYLVFAGGGNLVNGLSAVNGTEVSFRDVPWTASYGAYGCEGGNMNFDVAGMSGGGVRITCSGNGVASFTVDDAFLASSPAKWWLGWGTFDLNGTQQTASELKSTEDSSHAIATGGTIAGEAGSALSVVGSTADCVYAGNLTGGVSLKYAGGDGVKLTLLNRDVASSGNVEVLSGTLALSNSTWMAAGEVRVTGGRMTVGRNDAFGRHRCALYVKDGVLELVDGASVSFVEAYLWNSEKGEYEKVQAGDVTPGSSGIAAHIAGDGVVRIGRRGMMMFFR